MNTFSASEIHILGHMFLSRRKSRGEADGHKLCQKGFREAVLHTVIPWYKLASISTPSTSVTQLLHSLRESGTGFLVLHSLKHR